MPPASWRPYGPSSPFNTPSEGSEVHPNSAVLVQEALSWGPPANLLVGTAGTSNDWSHPVYYAQPSDPVYTLHATEPWGRNVVEGMKIRVPQAAQPAGGGDGHMSVVEPDGWEYDFWRAHAPPPGGGNLTFAWGGRTRIDGGGLESGATAADFGSLAGMIRAPELAAGKINHALFITLKCVGTGTSFGYGEKTTGYGSSYVYPATHGGSGCGPEHPNMPPMGAHIVLAMSEQQIRQLIAPAWKKAILTALARYGGYVGDTGGPGFGLMTESSSGYTALGLGDPLVEFAIENLIPPIGGGRYALDVSSGVNWSQYLRVVAPPG